MKKISLFILLSVYSLVSFARIPAADVPVEKVDSTLLTNLTGVVRDKVHGRPIAQAKVELLPNGGMAVTDAKGQYLLRWVPAGRHHVYISAEGYQPTTEHVDLQQGKLGDLNIELRPDAIQLNGAVVTGSRVAENRRKACSLVGVISAATLDKVQATDLSQGLRFQPGVRVENDCQNCGFSQVRINGLDGPYSQILIDSRPVFSTLVGVYGLEQIPANMIDRVEVLRGGGSALYGASAIAGTINVITKEPQRNAATASHELRAFEGGHRFENLTRFNASLVAPHHRMGLAVYGQNRHRSAYDADGDGYSELPVLDGRNLGLRTYFKPLSNLKLTLAYGAAQEYRRGGDLLQEEPQNAHVAEQIRHVNQNGNFSLNFWSKNGHHKVDAYGAFITIHRTSYYGGAEMTARELMAALKEDKLTAEERADALNNLDLRLHSFGRTIGDTYMLGTQYAAHIDKLFFMPATITLGAEYTKDKLEDKSGFRPSWLSQQVHTSSAFLQNEWRSDRLSLIVGTRLDKHSLLSHPIFSPRFNVRFAPISALTLRAGYSRGFRAPQIFDEDLHVDNAGGDLILSRNSKDLKEEISNSFTFSADWYQCFGDWQLNVMANAFYTQLSDAFAFIETPMDGHIDKLRVNSSGAKVWGTNLEARWAYMDKLTFQGGWTWQRSRWNAARQWNDTDSYATRRMYRTPDTYAYFVATYTPIAGLSCSLTGNYTGSMLTGHEIPTADDGSLAMFNGAPAARIHPDRFRQGPGQTATTYGARTVQTPTFFELGAKVAYDFNWKGYACQAYVGVKNMFNAFQDDFDRGPLRNSNYIYGPMAPRTYFMGVKFSL